jgi:hypothetical protein
MKELVWSTSGQCFSILVNISHFCELSTSCTSVYVMCPNEDAIEKYPMTAVQPGHFRGLEGSQTASDHTPFCTRHALITHFSSPTTGVCTPGWQRVGVSLPSILHTPCPHAGHYKNLNGSLGANGKFKSIHRNKYTNSNGTEFEAFEFLGWRGVR